MATKLAGRGTIRRERRGSRAGAHHVDPGGTVAFGRLRSAGLSSLRALNRVARRTPIAPLLRVPPLTRLRRRLFRLEVRDVLRLLDVLERTGVRYWVGGGWGVDALLGKVTRPHSDLDVVLTAGGIGQRLADVNCVAAALAAHGFTVNDHEIDLTLWFPERMSLRNRAGHMVDLLPIDAVPDTMFAMGTIAGRRVPCLAPATQVQLHSGYDLRAEDQDDVEALCEHFGLRPVAGQQMGPDWH